MEYHKMAVPEDKEIHEEECKLCGIIGGHAPDCVMHKYYAEYDENEPEK